MTCERCGEACNGHLCSICGDMEHQESYYGVPSDNYEDSTESWGSGTGQTKITEADDE